MYKLSSAAVISEAHNELHVMDGRSRIAVKRVGSAFSGDSSPAVRYNLEDHLGNSSFSVDLSGSLISQEEYFPFGETSFGSFGKKRYRFCGKERDEESGLYYYGARYYAPWACRFVSIDPLAGEYPFYTPYQYAGNQPINFIDLDGLEQGFADDNGNDVHGAIPRGGVEDAGISPNYDLPDVQMNSSGTSPKAGNASKDGNISKDGRAFRTHGTQATPSTPKVGFLGKVGSFFSDIGTSVGTALRKAVVAFSFAASTWAANHLIFDCFRPDPSLFREDETSARIGQVFGDALAILTGMLTTQFGDKIAEGGALATPETGIIGAGVAVTGAAVAVYGGAVTTTSTVHLWQDLRELFAKGNNREEYYDNDTPNGSDLKKLSKGEIKKLQEAGHDPHEMKGIKNASKRDLFKDKAGDVYVNDKSGKGTPEPTHINLNQL